MKGVVAMVLAGGRVQELGVLTRHRPKAAVPFGGQNLVIDYVMSNLALSGVQRVGILSQFRPSRLIDHVGAGEPWNFWGRDRFAKILPPFQGSERWSWYQGTADAIHQNRQLLEGSDVEHVLVLSGDHAYRMDYRPLLEYHLARGADVTAVFKRLPGLTGTAARYGIAEVDGYGRITGYEEKPERARSDLASLTIYLFRRDALLEQLTRNFEEGETHHLYDEVIPAMVADGGAYCYEYEGYWAYARTTGEYFAAHIALLDSACPLGGPDWPLWTNEETLGLGTAPPAYIGPLGQVRSSRLAPGARVEGTVERSILGPGVRVAEGAAVRDSVLLGDCVVAGGAEVTGVVADLGVRVEREARVGGPPSGACVACNPTVLGEGTRVPPGARIGCGCTLAAESEIAPGECLEDGTDRVG